MSQGPPKSENRSARDAALHCPNCDYVLVGLPENRCPECGREFDPAALRQAQFPCPPWFEIATPQQMVPAFWGTWFVVLASPRRFARQTLGELRGWRAAIFAAICFSSTLLSLLMGAELALIAAWLTTAAIYLVMQTAWMVALDWPHRIEAWRSARYWLAVGGYTSAIVFTEWYYGPPLIMLGDLIQLLTSFRWQVVPFSGDKVRSLIFWAQVIVWLSGVVSCLDARLSARARSLRSRVVAGVICFVTLLVLYAATIEHIGGRLYEFFGDVPGLQWKLR